MTDVVAVLDAALDALGVAASFVSSRRERPVAIGWATVDLDRAVEQLVPILPAGAVFRGADRSIALGAACRVADKVPHDWPVIVLLEPDTEGRLAATLARSGEGWAAEWSRAAGSSRVAASPVRSGPLGPERLRLGDPVHGPHHLLL